MLGEEQQQRKVIQLRSIPKKQAEKKILDYVDAHPGSYTSEIFMTLQLDPRLVYDILHDLERENVLKVEKVVIESRKK
jgi:hypothetical protein